MTEVLLPARQAPWRAYLSAPNLPNYLVGKTAQTSCPASASCRSLVEPRITERFTWVVGPSRRARREMLRQNMPLTQLNAKRRSMIGFQELHPHLTPHDCLSFSTCSIESLCPSWFAMYKRFHPVLHHARLFFAISHLYIYCSG